MNKNTWAALLVFGVVVLVVLVIGLGVLSVVLGMGGRMGPGMMGRGGALLPGGLGGLLRGRCPLCGGAISFGPRLLGGLFVLLFVLGIPLALLVLLIVGIVWLVRKSGSKSPPAPQA